MKSEGRYMLANQETVITQVSNYLETEEEIMMEKEVCHIDSCDEAYLRLQYELIENTFLAYTFNKERGIVS